jgi:dolichyl-phosphate-mannose--protein O-mannosyl transferase
MARMASDARADEYRRADPTSVAVAEHDGDLAADSDTFALDRLAEPSLVIEQGSPEYAADPAESIVPVGQVPAVRPPVGSHRRLLPPMPTDVARGWIVTAALTLIGGILRFWQLGWRTDGGTPLFDEKYYAVQAAEMIRTGGVEDNQAFGVIVHPPLGKQLIALGELLLGYTPTGWRLAAAVCGTLAILIVIRAVRRLTRSTMLGGVAGVLLICDGVSQVMAHTALLDSIQTPFVIGAFACLVADRDLVRRRLAVAVADGSMAAFGGGAPLGARWWRFAAGFLLGCATAVKWNGAYWIVAFGIMSVLWDVAARRQFGLRNPISAVFRRDFFPSLWSLGVVPLLTYVGSYWAWFLSETGWDRHVTAGGDGVMGALRSLVTMTVAMLHTTATITTPTDPAARHPWESKPWAWPLSTRPVLYYLSGGEGTTGCGEGHTDCVKRILLVGTPMLWWVSLIVLGWALWKTFARLDWRYAAVLVGYGAGYLPWFTIFDRQMYFFYMTPVAPFLIIGITLMLGDVLGAAAPGRISRRRVRIPAVTPAPGNDEVAEHDAAAENPVAAASLVPEPHTAPWLRRTWARMRAWDGRTVRLVIVCAYIGLVAANFIWMWPILMGEPITPERLRWETWLPSWG